MSVVRTPTDSRLNAAAVHSVLLQDLGKIIRIRVWHDNTGQNPSWFVSRIIVTDILNNTQSTFICREWLGIGFGDGSIDRTFMAADDKKMKELRPLFLTKLSNGFNDDHLWFSIAMKPPRSAFSRCQRVTCCLCTLLCAMLANAMFYQTSSVAGKQVNIGGLRFSWRQVIVGIQSAFIVIPINLIIVLLFRRATQPPPKIESDLKDLRGVDGGAVTSSKTKESSTRAAARGLSISGVPFDENMAKDVNAKPNRCIELTDSFIEVKPLEKKTHTYNNSSSAFHRHSRPNSAGGTRKCINKETNSTIDDMKTGALENQEKRIDAIPQNEPNSVNTDEVIVSYGECKYETDSLVIKDALLLENPLNNLPFLSEPKNSAFISTCQEMASSESPTLDLISTLTTGALPNDQQNEAPRVAFNANNAAVIDSNPRGISLHSGGKNAECSADAKLRRKSKSIRKKSIGLMIWRATRRHFSKSMIPKPTRKKTRSRPNVLKCDRRIRKGSKNGSFIPLPVSRKYKTSSIHFALNRNLRHLTIPLMIKGMQAIDAIEDEIDAEIDDTLIEVDPEDVMLVHSNKELSSKGMSVRENLPYNSKMLRT